VRRGIYTILGMLSITILILWGCSNQKNTIATRTYHNVTAYFNAYYNGDLAYREGLKKIEQGTKDNYNDILPIFVYSIKGASSKGNSDMDRAFKKASKVIQKHSITAKPSKRPKNKRQQEFYDRQEYVKWTWHSYMLIGKSHFMRRDFFAAIEAFTYVIQTYNREPIKYDAQLWLARTYVEMGNIRRAETLLQLLESTEDFPKHLHRDLFLIKADFHLKQNQLELAAKNLEEAVVLTKSKKEKYRYEFILAQIYQRLGDDRNAVEKYKIVLRRNNNYDMAFNARINLAQLASKDQKDNSYLKKELRKMIREDKNSDYLDQLYFALGKIALNEGNINEAIDLFLQSAHKSKINNAQKGLAYLELGKIYFEQPNYSKAQIYLDSAMKFVSQNIPDYKSYKRLSENLNELVQHLTVVSTQDSLQRVARMSEPERNSLIDRIIADLTKKEQDEKAREQMNRMASAMAEQRGQNLEQSFGGGGWYFYNPNTLAAGAIQFEAKWGQRPLEDDWRRSDKASTGFDLFSDQQGAVSSNATAASREIDPKKREFYLQNLPLTDSAMRVSDSLIHVALYKAAGVYKEKIEDLPLAAETYLKLLTRFPETIYELQVWYNLYKIYTNLAEEQKANEYKQKLLSKYPESRYAQAITNPDFYRLEAEKEQALRFLYSTTYRLFRSEQYDKVIEKCQFSDSAFPANQYRAKFALLKAIAVGKTTDSATFVKTLDEYIRKFATAPEVAYARDLFNYLTRPPQKPQGVQKTEEKTVFASEAEAKVEYAYDPKAEHIYVALINTEKKVTNKIKFNLGNMNIDYYPMFEFQIQSSLFSAGIDIITVEKFKDAVSGLNYYQSVIFLDEVFSDITSVDYQHFIITSDNLEKLRQTKSVQTYLDFFKRHYLEGKK